jgi:hypothetical protein
MPISAAAASSIAKLPAIDNHRRPTSVIAMPTASANGIGRRSVYMPTAGCSSEAVTCWVIPISPTCAKVSANDDLSSG